ncbi:helix-turn-helix domain-containing protein [Novosphingobium sp. KCTC 2891]|uniref:helix-turn-helix domain-containing protein n=1 Tax=Novosphingobium sp. KCTC 2891 TaxID=2989730 RepID=UPI0022235EA6|nr:helix-turn-helix domain-containing protein [Novosphingobium sp. KCTC 2891]MCW1383065.1 helix-turn-helix domain-containing protein [Novosphingobium sp. KCTC 2891]
MTGEVSVRVRFHQPPAALRPYFTTFYITEITVPSGGAVLDYLHPEWANLRIFQGSLPDSDIGGHDPLCGAPATFTGPTSTSVRFSIGTTRIWGIGFLPLGWARFVDAPAHVYADRLMDPLEERIFAPFRPLIENVFGECPDKSAELARIADYFTDCPSAEVPDEARISACHTALIDPEIASVADLAVATGLPPHTLERLCRRHFGFPPSLLLRRQRFMRSLSQYMLDPSLKWIGAIDGHYHDQAQFVRDFHRFMGMSPSHYAALRHPVLSAVMRARQEAAGAAVQALHPPATKHPAAR